MVVLVGVFTMALSSEGVQKYCLVFTAAQRKCTDVLRCVETHWNRVRILVDTFKHCAVVLGAEVIFKVGHEIARVFQGPC